MTRLARALALAVTLLAAQAVRADPEEPAVPKKEFERILAAIQARDIGAFTADGDEQFKAMPLKEFVDLTDKFAPLLASDYSAAYLGAFKRGDTWIYYWRLSFPSDPDDWVAQLGRRGLKIRGFVIKRPGPAD